jgi:hypothetical protein
MRVGRDDSGPVLGEIMRHISLLLAAAILASAPAGAATLLEQTGLINGGAVISTADKPTFDDFSLSDAATINSVSWWAQLGGPTTGNFTISFTTSDGFYPDLNNVLYSQTVSATSHTVGFYTEKFDVDLPVAPLLVWSQKPELVPAALASR